ncbi:MAG TPA: TRIC cation channel family protein [Anaerolineales bacterium]|nr:TRIC cation channel family protein [Anaerolineales bacterium]
MFGGILRDVLCNKIPQVFKSETELYAACSFIGTWVFIILVLLHVDASLAAWIGTFTVLGLRILAVRFRLMLPLP